MFKIGSSIRNYKILEVLHPGAGLDVYLVENLKNRDKLVLKSRVVERTKRGEFEKLIVSWKELSDSCEFISKFTDFFYEENYAIVLMDFCDGNDLDTLIKKKKKEKGKFPENEIAKIALDIFSGLHEMHLKKIIHRDINCRNILVSKNGVYKLANFDISHALNNDNKTGINFGGTTRYIAPEVFDKKEYTFVSDVYSVGAVLYELFALAPAFSGMDMPSIIANKYNPIDQSLGYSEAIVNLVYKLLSLNPTKRPLVPSVLANETLVLGAIRAEQRRQTQLIAQLQRHNADVEHALLETRQQLAEQGETMATCVAQLAEQERSNDELRRANEEQAKLLDTLKTQALTVLLAQAQAHDAGGK